MAFLGSVSAITHHHHHHHQHPVAFAQGEGEGEKSKKWTPADSRKLFEAQREEAFNTVKIQRAFEAKKTADVETRNVKDTKEARSLRNKVSKSRTRQMAGDYPQEPYPTVKSWASPPQTLAQEEPAAAPVGPKAGTPAFSYKEKADSLSAVTAAVAEQERFMAEHNAMVAKNFSDDDTAAKSKRAYVSRARQTQLQGGMDY